MTGRNRRTKPAGTVGSIAPLQQEVVWLDVLAYREVSANVNFSRQTPGESGDITVRIAAGKGTGHALAVDVKADRAGIGDANGGGDTMVNIHADDWRSLVALHGAIGAAIAKAREIGWCDASARFHGSDAPLMGESTEADDDAA